MRIILVGHPGSQQIVPASRYLLEKYLPGFTLDFINHTGAVEFWSSFCANYLEGIQDDRIIFTLDDYLVNAPMDRKSFDDALAMTPCVKLCVCADEEHRGYPVPTQYTIWDRKELIVLLRQTTTPWDFEINGSKLFRGKSQVKSCIFYDTRSALSNRWAGVRTDGVKEEDLNAIRHLL